MEARESTPSLVQKKSSGSNNLKEDSVAGLDSSKILSNILTEGQN